MAQTDTDLTNKVAVITGANSGIGKVAARQLASMGARVVMICRNRERGEEARSEIIHATQNSDVILFLGDLSDQKQVRAVAHEFCEIYDRADILINNAGIIDSGRHETPDGIERTLAVNHLGAFLLTNLLMKRLINADEARIITVSSEAHKYSDFDIENVQLERGYSPLKAYANSKLCNILFTYELNRRIQSGSHSMIAKCLHPGAVATKFGYGGSIWFKLIWLISKPFLISPEKGAETMVYLATDPDITQNESLYYKNKKAVQPIDKAYNPALAKKLWQKSVELTNLSDEDQLI